MNKNLLQQLQSLDPDDPDKTISRGMLGKLQIAALLDLGEKVDTLTKSIEDLAIRVDQRLTEHEKETRVEIAGLSKRIEVVEERLDDHDEYMKDNPPLIWYFRFRTRETLVVLFFLLAVGFILSLSPIRDAILHFFGLPFP